jgi:hypothetical protein
MISEPDGDKAQRPWYLSVLRWIAVLPGAVIGSLAAKVVGGILGLLITALISLGGTVDPHSVYYYEYLVLLFVHFPRGLGFVLAGAVIAPRFRLITAVLLGLFWTCQSLMIHVLGQQNPGYNNYTHFAAETLRTACGIALFV